MSIIDKILKEANLKLYHGSDTKFSTFDLNKAGSGEGSNLFGKGIYLTTDKDIADFYGAHKAKQKYIVGYAKGIFDSLVPIYDDTADAKAEQEKVVNEFNAHGKFLNAEKYSIDDTLRSLIINSCEKHWYRGLEVVDMVNRIIDYGKQNKSKIRNFRGELIYVIGQIANKEVTKDIVNYLESKGYDGIRYRGDTDFEGKDSWNYFIMNPNSIK